MQWQHLIFALHNVPINQPSRTGMRSIEWQQCGIYMTCVLFVLEESRCPPFAKYYYFCLSSFIFEETKRLKAKCIYRERAMQQTTTVSCETRSVVVSIRSLLDASCQKEGPRCYKELSNPVQKFHHLPNTQASSCGRQLFEASHYLTGHNVFQSKPCHNQL